MQQSLNPALNAVVTRDPQGQVRSILFRAGGRQSQESTPIGVAVRLLSEIAEELGIAPAELANLSAPPGRSPIDAAVEYRFVEEKRQPDTVTVGFYQTLFGLPVWEAGLSVTMKSDSNRVLRIQSTLHPDLRITIPPSPQAIQRFSNLGSQELFRLLDLDAATRPESAQQVAMSDGELPRINQTRFMVYRYDAARRLSNERRPRETVDQPPGLFHGDHYTLPIPPVNELIRDGEHYVILEVLFSLRTAIGKVVNWRALIEIETGSVLLLRALIENATGMVFETDPSTQNAAASPSQTAATLDVYRSSVTLPGVRIPSGVAPVTLNGFNVAIDDFEVPTISPPSEVTGIFNYSSRTDNFAAVNAYFHCDRFFRLVEGLGFIAYFGATVFPIQVDHRGHLYTPDGIEVNAYCGGNSTSDGIGNVGFMLADLSDTTNPLGIASDWRVVLHELGGHGILWSHVNSPNLGFSHSAGDSFGAILNDPGNAWVDRFETFPFSFQSLPLSARRFHNRDVTSGWAWGGANDNGGYDSEQILCTTHFRIYRSVGGDSLAPSMKEFAARFTVYLMVSALGSLTPATNPSDPADYADALMAADLADWTSEGERGGAYGKVIRWAFEKQGLYQPVGAVPPFTSEGDPPAVDVYVDDGRAGEYTYQPVHWDNQSIWNRRAPDGLTVHEEPIVGVSNFGYVIVSNRGTQNATGVSVRGFHCNPGSGLVWPDDWQPTTTASLLVPDIPPGGSVTVGPFEWVPTEVGHECMLMIAAATDDPSNADLFTGGADSIPEWRLVPNDNNIGQRNVHPVAALHGLAISDSIKQKTFTVTNSFRQRALVQLEVKMPLFLTDRGWQLTFLNPNQEGFFELDAGEKRPIRMEFVAGAPFFIDDVLREAKPPRIDIQTIIAGIPVGGMSFYLDPNHVDSVPVPR